MPNAEQRTQSRQLSGEEVDPVRHRTMVFQDFIAEGSVGEQSQESFLIPWLLEGVGKGISVELGMIEGAAWIAKRELAEQGAKEG